MWKKIDWKNVKTLTINDCDPAGCRFQQCPLHTNSANPFPIKPVAEHNGPGVVEVSCNQNALLARALVAFADKLKKKGGRHGAVV